jgi:phosphoribosyl-AMP cyclohydrolase
MAGQSTNPADETLNLQPRWDAQGLITAVAQLAGPDGRPGEIVMLAHMNAKALQLTIDTGVAHYWSRSRGAIWKKGETSGNMQSVREIRIDCDQDAVLLIVDVQGDGNSCHTGRKGCFYRRVEKSPDGAAILNFLKS